MLNRAHREAIHAQMEAVRGVHEAAGLRVRGPGKPCVVPAPTAPAAVEIAAARTAASGVGGRDQPAAADPAAAEIPPATRTETAEQHQAAPPGAAGWGAAAAVAEPPARTGPQTITHTHTSNTTRPVASDIGGRGQPAVDSGRQRTTKPAASAVGGGGQPAAACGGQRSAGEGASEQASDVRAGDTGHGRLTTNHVTRKQNSITQKRSRGEGRAGGPARHTKARTAPDNASRNT